MSIKYEDKKSVKDKFDEILQDLLESNDTFEINIKEEKLNDKYENVDIKIRRLIS